MWGRDDGGDGLAVERQWSWALEMVVGSWHSLCEQNPGHFNTGQTQPVLASLCGVILDLRPPHQTLLFCLAPFFRGESAATGQLVIKRAAAGMRGVFLTTTKFTSALSGRRETPDPGPCPKGQGADLATGHGWPFVPLPQHAVVPEGRGCSPVSNRIRTQSRASGGEVSENSLN